MIRLSSLMDLKLKISIDQSARSLLLPFQLISSTHNQARLFSSVNGPFSNKNLTIHRSSHLSSRTYITNTKDGQTTSEKALLDELRRLSHRQDGQSTLGPFMMPRGTANEEPLRVEEIHHWSRVSWTEKILRVLRLGKNLVIVGFGGCLGLLVIYSITSELFAPSSPTNLMNMTIRTLEESDELKKILKPPIKFHSSPMPVGNSLTKRTNGIPQSTSYQSGSIELRFWVESSKPSHFDGDWKTWEWWKSWIGPLITSQVNYTHQAHDPANRSSESISKKNQLPHQKDYDEETQSWWPSLLKSIMPSTFGQSSGSSTDQRSWSERLFTDLESFDHGEVVAELIKEPNGQWKYKSLTVDFPDSLNVKYRLNVMSEIRKKLLKHGGENNEEGHRDLKSNEQNTRFRFWNRRMNS